MKAKTILMTLLINTSLEDLNRGQENLFDRKAHRGSATARRPAVVCEVDGLLKQTPGLEVEQVRDSGRSEAGCRRMFIIPQVHEGKPLRSYFF